MSSPVPESDRVPLTRWLAVFAVSVGTFSVVTAEQLPIGVLTQVGSALEISEGTVGLMVTVPGIVAAISALLLPVAVGRLDRRLMMVGLMTLMAAANLMSAFASSFAVLLVSRVLVGVSIGGFFAIAASLASRLVPQRAVPRATSLVFGGVAAAAVLGIPAGTLIGELSGWRTAFAALGALGLVVLVALLFLLPPLPATQPVDLRELSRQLGNTGVRAGVIATFLIVTGHFAAYTFVSPILQTISGIDVGLISTLLLAYGVAGIVGNFICGSAAGRDVYTTVLTISLALTASILLFPLLGASSIGGVVLLIAWGLSYGGVSVSLQTWMLKAAPDAREAASALWVSMFNLSIALGALIGGVVVDGIALQSVLWLAGVLVILAVFAVWSTPKASLSTEASGKESS